jgi:hypothetical protein
MAVHARGTLAWTLAVAVLVLSVAGSTHAAANTKTFRSTVYHFAFTHPSSWSCKTQTDSGTSTAEEACLSKDQLALVMILVANEAMSTSELRSGVTTVFRGTGTVKGSIKYRTLADGAYQATGTVVRDGQRVTENLTGISSASRTVFLDEGLVVGFTKQDA